MNDDDMNELCEKVSDLQKKGVGNKEFGETLIKIGEGYLEMARDLGDFNEFAGGEKLQ